MLHEKVLITGATGFIGYEVARQLSAAGIRPRLMVRRPERAALLRPLDAELVSADLTSPASLKRATRGIDTVIHLGARAAFESYRRLRPTIIDGSLSLFRAAREAGASQFVLAGSLMVYGGEDGEIDAATPPRPRIDYGRAKLEAEESLRQLSEESGIYFASLRLPHVYGARDLMFERIHRGFMVLAGQGDNHFAHLHVEDAARLLIEVAKRRWTGVSPVADDLSATWREFFALLEEHYPRARSLPIPYWVARLGTELLRPLSALRSRPSPYTPDTVVGWNLELPVKPGLVWSELGLRPRYPTIAEGIPAVLDEQVAFRWLHPHADPARY